MAIERWWPAVAPRLFTADGGSYGQIQVADTRGFKVKQLVAISATGQPDLQAQVKRVLSETQMIVGIISKPLNAYIDISAYTVAAGAFLYANEQEKAKVVQEDREYATYDQEPTVAWRQVLVDELGRYYSSANPLPVNATVTVPPLTVRRLTDKPNDGTPDNLPDAVQIGDGTNRASVNNDGSFNVNIVSGVVSNKILKNLYNEINSVAANTLTNIVSYTVPPGKTAILEKVSVSGENIARFDVLINGVAVDTRRTYFGILNEFFDFSSPDTFGMALVAADEVKVTVIHQRPSLASFEARIQIVEIT